MLNPVVAFYLEEYAPLFYVLIFQDHTAWCDEVSSLYLLTIVNSNS